MFVCCLGDVVCSAQSAPSRTLSVSVFLKEPSSGVFCIQIENPTDETIVIHGVSESRGALAPFKSTDTYTSPLLQGTVSEHSSPYFEIEMRFSDDESIHVVVPKIASDQRVGYVSRRSVSFTFAPNQRFTFTTSSSKPPVEVIVKYIEAPKTDKKISVTWKKKS
jgi:hypothetical protein